MFGIIKLSSPSFCHSKSSGDNESHRGWVLTELFHSSSECLCGLRNYCFSSAVDALNGGQVEFPVQIGALLQIASELGQQEVRCESQFNGLKIRNDQRSNKL